MDLINDIDSAVTLRGGAAYISNRSSVMLSASKILFVLTKLTPEGRDEIDVTVDVSELIGLASRVNELESNLNKLTETIELMESNLNKLTETIELNPYINGNEYMEHAGSFDDRVKKAGISEDALHEGKGGNEKIQ